MKNILLLSIFAFTVATSQAALILYDYTAAPITTSLTAGLNVTETGNLFFSLSGVDLASGELQINLLADGTKNAETSNVQLGSGFKTALLNDVVSLTTIFTQGVEDLISISGKNTTAAYDEYLALEFDAGNGDHYYGWAKVRADVSQTQSSKTSASSFSVSTFAYNDTANESIVVGAIPEPAVITLVLGCGITALGIKRIFA